MKSIVIMMASSDIYPRASLLPCCLRYLLDRIVRKFGYDFVSDLVPKDDLVMQKRLKNIKKAQARKAKADEERRQRDDDSEDDDDDFRVRAKPKTMEEILADSDGDEEMEVSGDEGGAARSKQKKKTGKKALQTFIAEKDDGIVDFLDPSAAQMITSVKPKTAADVAKSQEKKRKEKDGGFKIAPDGRLIIKDDSDDDDSDDEARATGKKDFMSMALDSDEEDEEKEGANTFRALVSTNAARKRKMMGGSQATSRRSAATTTATAREPAMKYQAGGSGIHRPVRRDAKAKEQATNTFGAEYRSTKARGDVKRKGKPDPYAYVPLNKSTLNKRKKAKYEGQFKNLVNAAKMGAASGAKKKGGSKLAQKMKNMQV